MPSRRSLLRTAGAVTGGGFAGCTSLSRGVDGYVQLKSAQGRNSENGQQFEESIIRVTLSSPPGADSPELTPLSDEWKDRFDSPHEPTVSDGLHADLSQAYDRVRYVIGVCSPGWANDEESEGCYNVSTTRENFNSVQVHDRVRASSDGTSISIHSVDGKWTFQSE